MTLSQSEKELIAKHLDFLREVEVTSMTKSYKAVLLEAFQELDGWQQAPHVEALAERSWQVLQRRRTLQADLPEDYQNAVFCPPGWLTYWKKNPIAAWTGGRFFAVEDGRFIGLANIAEADLLTFSEMVQELVDFRLATYVARIGVTSAVVTPITSRPDKVELPYFPSLKIACGHFKSADAGEPEYRKVHSGIGQLDSERHFIAHAAGNSMNGGKSPIHDGDYLLCEVISPSSAGKLTGEILAIERQDAAGDNQYLLRKVLRKV